MKKSILFFAFLFVYNFSFSQVVAIYYDLDYNQTTDLFDCKMLVEDGTAFTAADRLLIDAQFSVIVATGTTIAVDESFLPIYDNETYTGTIPMNWSIGDVEVNPAELPGYDIIGIVPDPGGQLAHFNNLECCNLNTLFSLSATGGDICELSVRILNDDIDPTSLPSGNDFTNSMMIGSTNEVYFGNLNNETNWDLVDITIPNGEICEGDCITLEPSFNCIFPGMTYTWNTGETTETITVCPEVSTSYFLMPSGPFGNGTEVSVYVDVDTGIYGDVELDTDLCVGVPVFYFPEYGIWSSSDENIVTVTNDGIVTPISVGSATISHTTDSGNCLDEVVVTVYSPEAPIILGEVEICANETTQLSPSVDVVWESENPSIATIDETGLVTGVGLGSTVFTYTTAEGCVSEPSPPVSVLIIPEPVLTGNDSICRFEITTLTPNAGVTWESTDESIAQIDNSGNVTGVSEGTARFYFTDMATGCTSDESDPVMVLPVPLVQLSADTVCQGTVVEATTNMEGGEWVVTLISGSPNAGLIDNNGIIETDDSGVVTVQYVSENGCYSEAALLVVYPIPQPTVTSNSPICIGENLMLSASSPAGTIYSYEWTGPNGFSSNEREITILNADTDLTGLYTLIARENGCESDVVNTDIIIEDCDPCDDMSTSEGWTKVLASMDDYSSVGDYEAGGSLVTGRNIEDFVYYNNSEEEVILIKNNGSGYFDEEVVLFGLPYIGPIVEIDIVDIDQDGLNDIVTYQPEESDGTSEIVEVTITIFKNVDNYSFENSLQIVEDDGNGLFIPTRKYLDIDNGGFLDIIPLSGGINFTDNWEEASYQIPGNTTPLLVVDFNEDGLLDILGHGNTLFINNGDRTFLLTMITGDAISSQGLYDNTTGIFNDGYLTYQITTGSSPSIIICSDPAIPNYKYYFNANINSSNDENGVITTVDGFHVFELPMTCENSNQYESIIDFIPQQDGKIDFNGNGYSDFVTVEDGNIFVWVNPNSQPKLKGTAFIDNNGDGIFNQDDSPLRNVLISIEPGNLSVLTDDDGGYQFAVPEGTYTLTAMVNEGEWIKDELTIENFEINEPCNLGFDFGFEPEPVIIPMVNLSMVNTIARCDFEVKFTITVENTGAEPLLGILQFEFDDKTSFFSTDIAGASVIGNMVVVGVESFLPFQPKKYEIKVKMPSGSSVLPMLDFKASLVNLMGENIKEYGYTEQLRCSYDPNDKREFPDREGNANLTLMDEDIEYTIRFQNNGNDTAYNVKIIDPLDGNINPSSIRVVGSSHDVETCIEGTDLIFLFEDIYLVDSMTNYPGSQGYVTYKCNAKAERSEFTPVYNTADIIFDTNAPITTNQTINTLVSELCTDKSTIIDMYICDGDEYMGQSESGTYTESFELLYGCDSLVTINLTVQGITYSQQDVDVCEEGLVFLGTKEYYIENSTTIIDTIVNDQGCITNILNFEVTLVPDLIDVAGGFEFCLDEVGSIFPLLNGEWSSDDESVIEVDEQGNFTPISPGDATLQFIDSQTGCIDEVAVQVHPDPILSNEGSDQICINETNQFLSNTEGIWESLDPNIATISIDGLVLGKNTGTAYFVFTNDNTGCSESIEIIVLPLTDSNCLVSTEDLSSGSVKVYPNPASESIFVESLENWNKIKLINAQGQVILDNLGEYETKKRIDLNDISSGLYFLLVERESGIVMRRFVVD